MLSSGGLNAGQLKPAARSAEPREARPPPKAAGAGGAPEPREGRKRKLECALTRIECIEAAKREATKLGFYDDGQTLKKL